MARLTALPSVDIIRGFKKTVDFYLWKGLPCARAWPRYRPARQTPASQASALLFGQIIQAYNTLAPAALEAYHETAIGIPRTARDIYVSGVFGNLHQRSEPTPPPPPEEEMYNAYICLRDKKAQNTPAGTFTLGAWRTRTLTEEQADTADICALAANHFVLAAGTYRCLISSPAYRVKRHQARLYNVTGPAQLLAGTSAYSHDAATTNNVSTIAGRFTVGAAQSLRVEHRAEVTYATRGLGVEANFTDEIYTIVELWRETPPA